MSRILNLRNSTLNRDVLHNNKINNVLLSINGNYTLNKELIESINIFGSTGPIGLSGDDGLIGLTGMIGPTGPSNVVSNVSSHFQSTSNEWTNINTFNTFLPTTSIVPNLNTEITNKLYVDNVKKSTLLLLTDYTDRFRNNTIISFIYYCGDLQLMIINNETKSYKGKRIFNDDVTITHPLILNIWKYSPSTSDGIISTNVPATILIDNNSIACTLILPMATEGVTVSLIKIKNSTGIVTLNYNDGIFILGSSSLQINIILDLSSKFIFYDSNWYQI